MCDAYSSLLADFLLDEHKTEFAGWLPIGRAQNWTIWAYKNNKQKGRIASE